MCVRLCFEVFASRRDFTPTVTFERFSPIILVSICRLSRYEHGETEGHGYLQPLLGAQAASIKPPSASGCIETASQSRWAAHEPCSGDRESHDVNLEAAQRLPSLL